MHLKSKVMQFGLKPSQFYLKACPPPLLNLIHIRVHSNNGTYGSTARIPSHMGYCYGAFLLFLEFERFNPHSVSLYFLFIEQSHTVLVQDAV